MKRFIAMTTLQIFTSNRLEILARALAEVIKRPLASPLDKEVILVMSRGMERWLSMQIAQYHGVCANCRFPFPNAFAREVCQKIFPDLPERSPFDPKIMTWRIMKILPSCILKPGFESLKNYIGEGATDLKRFQLSERIADTFDQYLLFRPEMILRWERGQEEHWQAVLWRDLVKGEEKAHRAAVGKAFLEAVKDPSTVIKGLPERVAVFGISALPRFHIEVLAGLSRFTQVNLFLMNPCREYWGDILSEWDMKRTISRRSSQDLTLEELHLEKGNSLLASMGTLGRDFFDLVSEFDSEEFASFEDPGENSLLTCLQSDILNLRDGPETLDGKKIIPAHDSSIQIHSCHSPMREIEVLHDQLLHMFEVDSSLLPKDILVMTPDIEQYAPYIQAVFDIPAGDARKIPISIADRGIRKESEIIDAFLGFLDLCGSRFHASQVLAFLETPAVLRKFDLLESDTELIRRWVKDTRIRWGIDGESRGQMGLPSIPENSWRAGLDRLLLGYAMPGQDERMFGGLFPYDHIEGSEISVLGRFLEFAEQLFTRVTSLAQSRTLDAWSETLMGILDAFFMPDEDIEREMQVIRRMLSGLKDDSSSDGSIFDEEIDINVIKWHLGHSLEREGFGYGFMTGGVTFCTMLPMRSIPFKIICLVGMNGDVYPRQSRSLGFDLMTKHPKPGDRSRRNDDRYLFLEAMLSAREKLYISYMGQSNQDNSLVPPSALVSELMDYIEQGFKIPGRKILDHIMTRHRLQAFSAEYFKKNEKLFSYSHENFEAAQRSREDREAPAPFISCGLSQPEEDWKTVDLDNLCRFFGNPTRFTINRRLGMYLEEMYSTLEDREAFEIKGLEKYVLEQDMMEKRLAGRTLKDLFSSIQASGRLPHGTVGRCIYGVLSQGVEHFVKETESYMLERPLEPLEVDLSISGFRVMGRIDTIYPERLIQYRYGRVSSVDRLKVWIHHLALNSLGADSYPRTSVLVGLDPNNAREPVWAAWECFSVENSQGILGRLLEEYWVGLARPLHFFPQSSWTYVHMLLDKNKTREDALRAARNTWTGSHFKHGECEDPYYQLCFRGTDPLDSEFERIAEEVFGPFLRYQKDLRK